MKSSTKLMCAIALPAALAFSGAAQADGHMSKKGFYVGASAVGSMASDFEFNNGRSGPFRVKQELEFDPGFGALVRGGYDYGMFRTDVELGYRKIDIDKVGTKQNPDGDVNVYTAMINGYAEYENDTDFTPYLSIGAGVTGVDGDLAYDSTSGTEPARFTEEFAGIAPTGSVGVGLGYGLDDNIDLVGGYSLMAEVVPLVWTV